jgi:uncharacterized protein
MGQDDQVTMPPSERTTVKRYANRSSYDRAVIDAILDEGLVCHVGLMTDRGFPVVIPLVYGRRGDDLFLHGSAASRLFRNARTPTVQVCMTVTLVDGLVVARSTYNTDLNYRSVVVIGDAFEVRDLDEKRAGLESMVDHLIPGRNADARQPTEKELRSTMLLRLPLTEASAKVRVGWPLDETEDMELPIWAGVVPMQVMYGAPVPDPDLTTTQPTPAYLREYTR